MKNDNYISRTHGHNTSMILQNICSGLENKHSLKENTLGRIMCSNGFAVQAHFSNMKSECKEDLAVRMHMEMFWAGDAVYRR